MHIESHKSLKSFNTFGIECKARYFVSVSSIAELKEVLANPKYPERYILGGGSNMLLTQDIDALVVHINLRGIRVLSESDHQVILEVMAGENWHEFVLYCLAQGYAGVENLSLIPGNVGTAPIQNIGAYGVELEDIFESCNAIEIATRDEKSFDKEACNFGYRNSIFKNEAKGKFIITSVVMRLTKTNHRLNTTYGAVQEVLQSKGIVDPTPVDISEAVIKIRQSKLPDPALLGNSGSFFKNPVIDATAFQQFRRNHPRAPFYEVSATQFKIPAGWLIEQVGFKGQRFGEAGVHEKQALVLVNYGQATGQELWELALRIQQKVKEEFDIYLEPEVNVI